MDKIKDYILDGEKKAAIAYCRSVNTPAARKRVAGAFGKGAQMGR